MFFQANTDFEVDFEASWMIGDRDGDMRAGNGAGISNTIFIKSSNFEESKIAKYSVDSIIEIIEINMKAH